MKILYLTDQTHLHGGIEKVLSQKANYFADILNDEVIILTYNQEKKPSRYPLSKKIKQLDLGINYKVGKSYFHPDHLRLIPKHIRLLTESLKKLNPDVVISASFGPDFYFLPFVLNKIPKIKEFHSSRFFEKKNTISPKAKILKKVSDLIENKYDHLVILNSSEKDFYSNKKLTVLPNPVEGTIEISPVQSKKILTAGRISPVKNFGDLIEAFSSVSEIFPEWELHLFGEDYLGTQEKLQVKINEAKLQNQIKFKDCVADLKKEMKNYSIFTLTSETECFPMVLLEALSVGLPVISYDSPTGPKHILTANDDSFLIPYKNLDIFTQKLTILMENENLRQEMGRKGTENVQKFNIDKVMLQWKTFLNEVVDNNSH